jgi:hypothetical protein
MFIVSVLSLLMYKHLSVHLSVSLFDVYNYTRFCTSCQPPFFCACKFFSLVCDIFATHTDKNRVMSVTFLQHLHISGGHLPLWLTLNFPNLCISVYIRTPNGGVAPAYPSELLNYPDFRAKSVLFIRAK